MDIRENIMLERYKLVTSRQTYLVDMTKETFSSYAKTLATFVAGSFVLVSSAQKLLPVSPDAVVDILRAIAVFLTFAAAISTFQIYLCTVRWFEYRHAECTLNPDAPRPGRLDCLFEYAYGLAIVGSVALVWWGYFYLGKVLAELPDAAA